MSWMYLGIAIILEVMGTTCMKLSNGFTETVPSIMMFILYGLSFYLMALALKSIDVSIAYAIWAGMGTVLIVTVGILWFKEPVNAIKIISIGLIVIGIVGLNYGGDIH
jgi:small multidrug resistance pump